MHIFAESEIFKQSIHQMKRIYLSALFLFPALWLSAQTTQKPVFSYGKDTVFSTEFERIYSKNNNSKEQLDEKTIREYLDLFINFKLKVKEARALGLDTAATFRNELEGYKKQLAQPYLIDKEVTQALINEAYERMQYEVNSSHILIRVTPEDLPKDTLIAYNRLLDIRNMIMKGENFDSMAVKFSEDPSAKQNKGNLGYFSAFGLVYPFENMLYQTPVGSVSMPFRTQFGYHLVKVLDKRKNRGEIKSAHIMVKTGAGPEKEAEAKSKIDAIYAKLQAGESFESLVKTFSEDESTSKSGGTLGWFSGTSANFPADFKKAAFELKNVGDVSKPVKTDYGWHIIKKLEVKETPPLKDVQESIKNRISRDIRSDVNKQAVVERIKKDAGFKENRQNLNPILAVIDSTILQGKWNDERAAHLNKELFTLGNEKFTQKDFADYISNYQTPRQKGSIPLIVTNMYKEFVNVSALAYEEKHLEEKYPEFRNLIQEYREGILLFDLTDKKVWSKSVNDSVGLAAFHQRNMDKYMWKERTEVVIYDCADKDIAKKVKKLLKKKKSHADIMKEINTEKPLNLSIREAKYEKGENTLLDSLAPKETGMYTVNSGDRVLLINVKNFLPAQPKTLAEAKGSITADYQKFLEDEWIAQLRSGTPVYIFEENIKTLFK
jgi:peptidyl-prolyl cis-trans isomerase SurA